MEALLNHHTARTGSGGASDGLLFSSFGSLSSFQPAADSASVSIPNEAELEEEEEEFILGIDEAGRGPVLGPMVYAAFFYPKRREKELLAGVKLDDSKVLKDEDRRGICDRLIGSGPTDCLALDLKVGWIANALSPRYISNSMLQRNKYNLNTLSHDTVIDLVQRVHRLYGIRISAMFVDTVGPPESYQKKLKERIGHIVPSITVSKKADSLYPCVSGASIIAKVTRDHLLEHWACRELSLEDRCFGSGYPGDPKTIAWLNANLDPVFGYPDIIRFSWSTCEKILCEKGVPVSWKPMPEDEDETSESGGSGKKRKFTQKTLTFGNVKIQSAKDPAFSFSREIK